MTESGPALDVLTASAGDVAAQLDSGHITSQDVVKAYLAQIEKHNKQGLEVRAIISCSEASALEQAIVLDRERRNGTIRGPLHGVPVILKDCIHTSAELGMPTTAGAAVFAHAVARQDAEVVRRLREKGLIILGKASLTEFCGAKGHAHTAGWNTVNGQTQSAWIEGGVRKDDMFWGRSTPGGSSSGSAVGVAAGFAPLAIGSETGGSCCLPANRQGLYMLKLTHDPDLMRGVMPLCKAFDSLGAFGRTALDVQMLVHAMSGSRDIPSGDGNWQNIRIGFIEPQKWFVVPAERKDWNEAHEQIVRLFEQAMDRIRSHGAKVVYPLDLPIVTEFSHEGRSVLLMTSVDVDIVREWPEWIAGLDNAPAKSLKEIIEWNDEHPELGMPEPHAEQQRLRDVLNSSVTPAEAETAGAQISPRAMQAVEDCLKNNGVDIIVGPGDCSLCSLASIARCPSAMVPMGILEGEKGMGQPQGLMIISSPYQEAKMLSFMKLWSTIQGPWQIPTRLQ